MCNHKAFIVNKADAHKAIFTLVSAAIGFRNRLAFEYKRSQAKIDLMLVNVGQALVLVPLIFQLERLHW